MREGNTLEKLSRTHAYARMLKGAPLCTVACSDPERSPNHWVEDCSIAVENMLLAARGEGLGTCWIPVYRPNDVERENRIREVLSIPTDIRVIALVGVGYPAESPEPPARRRLEDIVHYENVLATNLRRVRFSSSIVGYRGTSMRSLSSSSL